METENNPNSDPKSPQNQSEKRTDANAPKVKKPYTTPRLTTYGNLENITKTIGMGSFNDGLGGKTH